MWVHVYNMRFQMTQKSGGVVSFSLTVSKSNGLFFWLNTWNGMDGIV